MAGQFRFRLKTVRKLRKQTEDRHRRIVAERLGRIGALQERLAGLHAEVQRTRNDMRHAIEPSRDAAEVQANLPLAMDDLRSRHVYVNQMFKCIEQTKASIQEEQAVLRGEQAKLAEASKQVKVIDKLEERQRAKFELRIKRSETAQADEIATQFARHQMRAKLRLAGGTSRP